MGERTCSVEGCERRHGAKGYCAGHYQRVKRTGDPGPASLPPPKLCSVDGCGLPHASKGYCKKHYQRVNRGVAIDKSYWGPRGPYSTAPRRSLTERIEARSQPAPLCKCGCGVASTTFDSGRNRWRPYLPGHGRRPAPYKDEQWLRRRYEGGATIVEIATECGASPSTVRRFAARFGIQLRPHGETLRMRGTAAKERNPAWRGGVTPERQRVYKTPEWRSLVSAVFRRDRVCQRCSCQHTRQNKFHAHHVASWVDAPERRMDPSNLVTLCDACHRWVHSRENVSGAFLARQS